MFHETSKLEIRLRTAQNAQALCQTTVLALTRPEPLELRELLAYPLLPHVPTSKFSAHARQLSSRKREIRVGGGILAHEDGVPGEHVQAGNEECGATDLDLCVLKREAQERLSHLGQLGQRHCVITQQAGAA